MKQSRQIATRDSLLPIAIPTNSCAQHAVSLMPSPLSDSIRSDPIYTTGMSILTRACLAFSAVILIVVSAGCQSQPHHDPLDPKLLTMIEEALELSMTQAGLSPSGPQQHKLAIQIQLLTANAADDRKNINGYVSGFISQDRWVDVLESARQLYLERINIGRNADDPDRDGLPIMLQDIFDNPESTQEQWVLARCWLRQLLIKEGLKAPPGWSMTASTEPSSEKSNQ